MGRRHEEVVDKHCEAGHTWDAIIKYLDDGTSEYRYPEEQLCPKCGDVAVSPFKQTERFKGL